MNIVSFALIVFLFFSGAVIQQLLRFIYLFIFFCFSLLLFSGTIHFALYVIAISSSFALRFVIEIQKMVVYAIEDYAQMILIYGECHYNSAAAARLYRERFQGRENYPTAGTIREAVWRLQRTGNVMPNHHDAGAPRQVRNAEMDEAILEAFREDPKRGLRPVAREHNISYTTTQRIMAENGMHDYKYTRVQRLRPEDYPARVRFCQWLLAQVRRDPDFLSNILYTDESTFPQDGFWNSKNFHYWAAENPHVVIPMKSQTRFSVKLWAGVINNKMVSFFLKKSVHLV